MKANQLLKTGRGHHSPCRFLKCSRRKSKFCLLLKYLQVIDDYSRRRGGAQRELSEIGGTFNNQGQC